MSLRRMKNPPAPVGVVRAADLAPARPDAMLKDVRAPCPFANFPRMWSQLPRRVCGRRLFYDGTCQI